MGFFDALNNATLGNGSVLADSYKAVLGLAIVATAVDGSIEEEEVQVALGMTNNVDEFKSLSRKEELFDEALEEVKSVFSDLPAFVKNKCELLKANKEFAEKAFIAVACVVAADGSFNYK